MLCIIPVFLVLCTHSMIYRIIFSFWYFNEYSLLTLIERNNIYQYRNAEHATILYRDLFLECGKLKYPIKV